MQRQNWMRGHLGNNFYHVWLLWASLVAQLVKNLPAMQETLVRFLGWEDPLEEGMATHSSILVWRIPMDRGVWWTIACQASLSMRILQAKTLEWVAMPSLGDLPNPGIKHRSPTLQADSLPSENAREAHD